MFRVDGIADPRHRPAHAAPGRADGDVELLGQHRPPEPDDHRHRRPRARTSSATATASSRSRMRPTAMPTPGGRSPRQTGSTTRCACAAAQRCQSPGARHERRRPQMVAGAEVHVNGAPLDVALAQRISEVRVQENLMLPDSFLIRFADPGLENIDTHPFADRRRRRGAARAARRRVVHEPVQGPGGRARAGVRPRRRGAGGARLRPGPRAQPHARSPRPTRT